MLSWLKTYEIDCNDGWKQAIGYSNDGVKQAFVRVYVFMFLFVAMILSCVSAYINAF